MSELIRLQKYIAQSGVASRRSAEKLINDGKVKVNGSVVTEKGIKINPKEDAVRVNGRRVKPQPKRYYLLNKPKGYVCTRNDVHADKTIFDLLPPDPSLHNVGRLDKETEGLLLITNDGELTQKLTHPSFEVEKTYRVLVRGNITEEAVEKLTKGIEIPFDKKKVKTLPAKVKIINRGKRTSTIEITLREGRKRQVRLMCDIVGFPVIELKRIKEDFLSLKGLKTGKYRELTPDEIRRLTQD